MGRLDNFVDVTGKMDQTEVNKQNILNIIDELNRSSDLLDAFNTNLKIISRGSTTYNWDGTINTNIEIDVTIGTSTQAYTFFCFFTRSSLPNNLYATPFSQFSSSGDLQIGIVVDTFASGNNSTLIIFPAFYTAGAAETFTFYYFIIQQPANITSS